MSLNGCTLRVINDLPPFEIGETLYCIEDCPKREIIRVWSRRLIFGVNEVILSYGHRKCLKIVV